MLSRRPVLAWLALSALAACGHAPPSPDDPGATAFYRQALADSPTGARAVEYRDALEASEFADARRKGTILSFRTFLSEFPDGPHQREARTLLESLRWNEASAAGTETALQGFLADEPRGAHSGEAWARIAALQLEAAEKNGSGEALRAWLAAHPQSPGRERAQAALAEIEFREAEAAPIARKRTLLRAFLAAHPESPRRAEAEELEARASIDEAALLDDLDELRAWARSGREDAAKRLAQLSLEEAAARLDAGELGELARARSGPDASSAPRAQAIVEQLKRLGGQGKPLIEAARTLYLPAPRPDLSDLPQAPRERARALREAALSLDGKALGPILSELAAQQGWVAEAALESALDLLGSLPTAEMQLRAARAAGLLTPIAQDGPHLAALALVLLAQGDKEGALAASRSAAARDPRSLVSQMVAAKVEVEAGDRALAMGNLRALLAATRAALDARATSSAPDAAAPPEGEAAPALWSLCAARSAAAFALARLAPAPGADRDDPARRSARDDAAALLERAGRAVSLAERSAHKEGACRLDGELIERESTRLAQARAAAAGLLRKYPALAAEALARARARDPSPLVRDGFVAE